MNDDKPNLRDILEDIKTLCSVCEESKEAQRIRIYLEFYNL